MANRFVTLNDILEAGERLRGISRHTPLEPSEFFSKMTRWSLPDRGPSDWSCWKICPMWRHCWFPSAAAGGANVISITHDRIKPNVPLKQAEVEIALETRNANHIEDIVESLEKVGYVLDILK